MEDFISKLKQFSKLDFQSKQEEINKGRPTPALKSYLITFNILIVYLFKLSDTHKKTGCVDVQRAAAHLLSAFLVFFSQPVTMSGLMLKHFSDLQNQLAFK